ncbi:MAG: substrate-binding domain-containing protein [Planctomycetota bacterium]|nr:substrate-binding domain-containing protein [Planctomycetota bacterium]
MDAPGIQPKYAQVMVLIQAEIARRGLRRGDRLPTRQALRERWNVANDTLDMAIRQLIEDGVLVARRGSGTFVGEAPAAPPAGAGAPTLDVLISRTREALAASSSPHTYLDRIEGIAAACDETGVRCRFRFLNPHEHPHLDALKKAIGPLHDGAILFQETLAARLEGVLKARKLPYVILGQTSRTERIVTHDYALGYREAFAHLYARGRRRVGYLGEAQEAPAPRAERLKELAAEAGLQLARVWWPHPEREEAMFEAAAEDAAAGRVDAIAARSDRVALRLLEFLKARALGVPDSVAVIGYDDIAEAAENRPPLSTIRASFRDEGREAVRLLARELAEGPAGTPGCAILPTSWIPRATT